MAVFRLGPYAEHVANKAVWEGWARRLFVYHQRAHGHCRLTNLNYGAEAVNIYMPSAPLSQSALPALDSSVLDELAQVIGNQTAVVIKLFLDDAPVLVDRMQLASQDGDLEALREAAHSLKSASANVGALALADAARRIELGARGQTLDNPGVAVALLIAEFARARMALRGWLAQHKAP